MPIDLVRWHDLTASLVRATDEASLVDTLDEVGDPGAASWEEYQGPLWIDLETPFEFRVEGENEGEPFDPAKIDVELPEDLADVLDMSDRLLTAHLGGAGTRFFMTRMLLRRLYPQLWSLISELDKLRVDEEPLPPPAELTARTQAAIRKELEPLIQYSWRRASSDRNDPVMAALGVTVPIGPLRDDDNDDDDDGQGSGEELT